MPLSSIISSSLLKFMPTESVMPSKHLILCCPLLLPPSVFPSIRVFSNESALRIRWPKYWHFTFTVSPSYLFMYCHWLCWVLVASLGFPLKHVGSFSSVRWLLSSCSGQAPEHLGSVVWMWRLSCCTACGVLVPWLGTEPMSPALEADSQSVDHHGSP